VAAPIVFSGYDQGAGPSSARPHADAAAAAFDLATGPLGLITFEALDLGAVIGIEIAPGVYVSAGNFVLAPAIVTAPLAGCIPSGCGYNTTVGGEKFLEGASGTLTFLFDTPIDAFGFSLLGAQLATNTLIIDGSGQSIPLPPFVMDGGSAFVGFANVGHPFASITLTLFVDSIFSGDIVGIDDIRFGTANAHAVPEPGTAALLGSSLLGLVAVRRLFRHLLAARPQRG
jgi:hypothetical protein